MLLQRSRFVHQLPVGENRFLVVHAVTHMQVPLDHEANTIVDFFAEPKQVPEDCGALFKQLPYGEDALLRAIAGLEERGILTSLAPPDELAKLAAELAPTEGRDPAAMLQRFRREKQEGAASYWSARASVSPLSLSDTALSSDRRVDVILFGDCDIQMESDFLKRNALKRGIDLHVAATFPDDVRFAAEHKHDAIFIGALRSRHSLTDAETADRNAHATYVQEAEKLLASLRAISAAPLFIDNLPEPTVQPLGLAEHPLTGHRARFRNANRALAELVSHFQGVYVIDVASELGKAGSERHLDDGQVGYTHFGSPGWMLQRPESEKAAVHGLFPDTAPLLDRMNGDAYGREALMAGPHIDALVTVLGIDRKKCIILDLDGTLWPGVLAETGSPFAWTPEISGVFSYVGLYFGFHEALLSLKQRGILLACVSKNDESLVRELWTYPKNYPLKRLLTLDDFVSVRINWNDKVDNIESIAKELGFALSDFIFIDDHPIERDRVRQRLPEVEVWGENPFDLRRQVLNDPRLQHPTITGEAASRTKLVKAQIGREQFKASIGTEIDYLKSLDIACEIERMTLERTSDPADAGVLERIEELFRRTTQFNTTGIKPTVGEMLKLLSDPSSYLFKMNVSDRFGDHGLVGAALVANGEILGLAISCRVLGLGVEYRFMNEIMAATKPHSESRVLRGSIIETKRNIPVRNIFKDCGFTEVKPGLWQHIA